MQKRCDGTPLLHRLCQGQSAGNRALQATQVFELTHLLPHLACCTTAPKRQPHLKLSSEHLIWQQPLPVAAMPQEQCGCLLPAHLQAQAAPYVAELLRGQQPWWPCLAPLHCRCLLTPALPAAADLHMCTCAGT
eukprot:GHRQ01029601.1.p3 GENE.GHRQ01029601.1~~GHRQ01029601.1.p3  ORF type:complete len:134 (+),score=30.95 GHRQ01029601.1:245-646(+)